MHAQERQPSTAEPVATPCINVCVIDAVSALCKGCGRTLAEIVGWRSFSGSERLAIMRRLRSKP